MVVKSQTVNWETANASVQDFRVQQYLNATVKKTDKLICEGFCLDYCDHVYLEKTISYI